jgi:hypothetical protein
MGCGADRTEMRSAPRQRDIWSKDGPDAPEKPHRTSDLSRTAAYQMSIGPKTRCSSLCPSKFLLDVARKLESPDLGRAWCGPMPARPAVQPSHVVGTDAYLLRLANYEPLKRQAGSVRVLGPQH